MLWLDTKKKAASFLKALGTTLYDNITPAESLFGTTKGQRLSSSGSGAMEQNGSLTMDDLMKGMAHMAEEGFAADTLLMHPLFYYSMVQDPVLRNMMLAHGGGSYFNPYTGNPGPQLPYNNGAMGAMGPSNGRAIVPGGNAASAAATPLAGRSQQQLLLLTFLLISHLILESWFHLVSFRLRFFLVISSFFLLVMLDSILLKILQL